MSSLVTGDNTPADRFWGLKKWDTLPFIFPFVEDAWPVSN